MTPGAIAMVISRVPTLPTAVPMISDNVQVAIVTFVVAPLILGIVGLINMYMTRRFSLSPETKQAVAEVTSSAPPVHETEDLGDFDEALRRLARQVGELDSQVRAYSLFMPQIEAWGERGWKHCDKAQRERKPQRPKGIPNVE